MGSGRGGRKQAARLAPDEGLQGRLNGVRPWWPETAPWRPSSVRASPPGPQWGPAVVAGNSRAADQRPHPTVTACLNGVRPWWPETGERERVSHDLVVVASMGSGRGGRKQGCVDGTSVHDDPASMGSGRGGRKQRRPGVGCHPAGRASMGSGRGGRKQQPASHGSHQHSPSRLNGVRPWWPETVGLS